MYFAPLPRSPGQCRRGRGDQADVGVRDDELDTGEAPGGEAPGGEVAEELKPARAVLAGSDLEAQDLAVAMSFFVTLKTESDPPCGAGLG